MENTLNGFISGNSAEIWTQFGVWLQLLKLSMLGKDPSMAQPWAQFFKANNVIS